ncbi:hypothetical protein K505DRAFT_365413 [Melanomma pulvis-pyrius CBS 109.77]|uniref:Uncharacterized protein n=1 Tax=Melanomma pulvis-pyrius CBS 109.77 TaxID=1314802 RepID=A0A6A6X0G0_9PLEO|nr:hypothetical protein K505DRAFT_365413 [Melanomma pulvis-pyrius CBS 109.77]
MSFQAPSLWSPYSDSFQSPRVASAPPIELLPPSANLRNPASRISTGNGSSISLSPASMPKRRSRRIFEEWERKRGMCDADARPFVSPRPTWPKEDSGAKNSFVVDDDDDDDDDDERELITAPFANGDSNGETDADSDDDIAYLERLAVFPFIMEVDPQPDNKDEDDFQLWPACHIHSVSTKDTVKMPDACTLDDIMAYVNANDSYEDVSSSAELDPLSLRDSLDMAELDDVELVPYGKAPEMRAGEMWAGGSKEPWTRGRRQKKGKGWGKWFGSCL